MTGQKIDLEVKEIKLPDLDARWWQKILPVSWNAESVIVAMQRAIQQGMRQGAEGVKVMVSGRLGGAEMSRSMAA